MPEIQYVPLADIYVPEERQREYNEAHAARLASFLKVRNFLDGRPIRLAPEKIKNGGGSQWRLLSGVHRYHAVKLLGWQLIPATFSTSNDPDVLSDEEFLENVHLPLNSLEWEREIVAFAGRHPDYTQQEISRLLPNGHQSDVSKALIASEYRSKRPDRAGNKPMHAVYKMAVEESRRERRAAGVVIPAGGPILCHNAVEWMRTYAGPKFNFIHCDFPYGINSDKSGQNPATFDDSPEVYWGLLQALHDNLDRFCAPDAHMLFWCSTRTDIQYETFQALASLPGFAFDEPTLIWHKGGNQGITPDKERRPRRMYETAFFGWRGDAKILNVQQNIYTASKEGLHEHEKPLEMLRYFFEMVVDEHTRLLDPTCGSGTALRAAKALGAAYYFGIEKDQGHAATALRALGENGYSARAPKQGVDLRDLELL